MDASGCPPSGSGGYQGTGQPSQAPNGGDGPAGAAGGPSAGAGSTLPAGGVLGRAKAADERGKKPSTSGEADSDVVQFATGTYYTEEDEATMVIDVVRIGSVHSPCSVRFETQDGTAKARTHYMPVKGTLEFKPHETYRTIEVPILDTPNWNATLEFRLLLSEPRNTTVAEPLNMCRVWIIDLDCFPSSKIEHDSSRTLLLREFYWRCWSIPVVRKGAIKMIAIDTLHNLYFVWQLVIQVFLVDRVLSGMILDGHIDLEHLEAAVLLGSLHFFPLLVLNALDLRECWYGVGGAARKDLQVNLLRKYLNYTEAARLRVGTSGFVEAINRHAVEVVDRGFMQLFSVASHAGKLLLLLLWALSTSALVFPPLIFVLVVMVLRMRARERSATLLRLKSFKTYDMLMMHAENVTSNFGLVRDYARRTAEALRMDALITDVNYFGNAVHAHSIAATQMVSVISTFFVAALMATSPWLVGDGSHGRLTIGTFLASLSAVKSMGSEAEALFDSIMRIQLSVSSLLKITFYMNMDTDVGERLATNRRRRAMARELRDQVEARLERQAHSEGGGGNHHKVAADEMRIQLDNVHLSHGEHEGDVSQFAEVNLSITQGRVVAVVGRHSSGKASLLRLVAGCVLPTDGDVFTPPHLRCVHVEQAPSLLAVTLFENLTLGATKRLGRLTRVARICTALGLSPVFVEEMERARGVGVDGRRRSTASHPLSTKSDHTRTVARGLRASRVGSVACALSQPVQDFAEDDMELRKQLQRMSWSDRCVVHLARAFIASPELLIMHRPLAVLDEDVATRVLACMREFVDGRGLAMDDMGAASRRRPHTCIFTCTQLDRALKIADDVIVVGMPDQRATMYAAAELKRDSSSELRRKIDTLLQETEHHKAEATPRKAAKGLLQPLQVSSVSDALGGLSGRRHGDTDGPRSGRLHSQTHPVQRSTPREAGGSAAGDVSVAEALGKGAGRWRRKSQCKNAMTKITSTVNLTKQHSRGNALHAMHSVGSCGKFLVRDTDAHAEKVRKRAHGGFMQSLFGGQPSYDDLDDEPPTDALAHGGGDGQHCGGASRETHQTQNPLGRRQSTRGHMQAGPVNGPHHHVLSHQRTRGRLSSTTEGQGLEGHTLGTRRLWPARLRAAQQTRDAWELHDASGVAGLSLLLISFASCFPATQEASCARPRRSPSITGRNGGPTLAKCLLLVCAPLSMPFALVFALGEFIVF